MTSIKKKEDNVIVTQAQIKRTGEKGDTMKGGGP
jgi:hypothetical protein